MSPEDETVSLIEYYSWTCPHCDEENEDEGVDPVTVTCSKCEKEFHVE